MTKFKNKYRIESTRLAGWDYTSAGWYFVTICTKNHVCLFGDIIDGTMHLSPIGEIVAEEWQKTPKIRPNVKLDKWVIMPNHLHGIVVITTVETPRRGVETSRRRVETPRRGVETPRRGVETPLRRVETPLRRVETPLRRVETPRRGVSTPPSRLKAGSLGAIIGQIKSICTKRIRAAGYTDFAWQARFYDHIIRNESSLERIREYVANNPATWKEDKINPVNVSP